MSTKQTGGEGKSQRFGLEVISRVLIILLSEWGPKNQSTAGK